MKESLNCAQFSPDGECDSPSIGLGHEFHDVSKLKYKKESTGREVYERLVMAKNYMDEHFTQIRSIHDVAKKCYMSRFHFVRSFHLLFHCTPYQYLFEKRIRHARQLIKTSPVTMSAVAIDCGFSSLCAFSKAFKRYYGFPPSHFIRPAHAA